jgi:hypothetical protein
MPASSGLGRYRIFLPTAILFLALVGLGGVWAFLAWRTGQEIDAWLQREASLGRTWACPDRSIGGFPFRIEIICANPTFTGVAEGRQVRGRLARIHTVTQIYNPSHMIVEAEGPLVVEADGGDRLEAEWLLGRASIIGKPGAGLERLSTEFTEPRVSVTSGRLGSTALAASLADFHIRRTPNRAPEDGAYDVASRITKATVPPLDAWLGGQATTEADIVATITKAEPLSGRGLPVELERWRTAGGRMQVSTVSLSHGARRLDAAGSVGLDELHRPQGRLDVTISGFDDLLARFGISGRNAAIGGLIAGVLGGKAAAATNGDAAQGATPAAKGVVLPLRLDQGRVFLGPIPVAQLLPLY